MLQALHDRTSLHVLPISYSLHWKANENFMTCIAAGCNCILRIDHQYVICVFLVLDISWQVSVFELQDFTNRFFVALLGSLVAFDSLNIKQAAMNTTLLSVLLSYPTYPYCSILAAALLQVLCDCVVLRINVMDLDTNKPKQCLCKRHT